MVNINKIKSLSKQRGITVSYLCESVGMGRGYLNDVAAGKTKIPDSRLEIIADKLGTTVEYLRDETDDPEIKKPSMVSWKGVEMSEDRAKLMDYIASLSDEQAEKIYRILKEIKGL